MPRALLECAGRELQLTDEAHLELVRPVLEAISTAIHHVGPLGAGQVAKTVNNILLWSNLAAALEALRLGNALG